MSDTYHWQSISVRVITEDATRSARAMYSASERVLTGRGRGKSEVYR